MSGYNNTTLEYFFQMKLISRKKIFFQETICNMQNRTISIRTKQGLTVISGTSCWRWSFWRRRRFYNWIAGRTPTKNYITKKIEKLYWEYVFKMSGWNFRQIRNFSRIKMGTSWRIIFVSKYYRSDMDNRFLC